MILWQRVKALIKQANTTQEWVAGQAGVSLNTFKGWIAKDIMPNADQALSIARALGVSVEYLLEGRDVGEVVPFRLRAIMGDLAVLPDDQLQVVGLQVKLMADAARAMSGKAREA